MTSATAHFSSSSSSCDEDGSPPEDRVFFPDGEPSPVLPSATQAGSKPFPERHHAIMTSHDAGEFQGSRGSRDVSPSTVSTTGFQLYTTYVSIQKSSLVNIVLTILIILVADVFISVYFFSTNFSRVLHFDELRSNPTSSYYKRFHSQGFYDFTFAVPLIWVVCCIFDGAFDVWNIISILYLSIDWARGGGLPREKPSEQALFGYGRHKDDSGSDDDVDDCCACVRTKTRRKLFLMRFVRFLLFLQIGTTFFYLLTDAVLAALGSPLSGLSDIFGDLMTTLIRLIVLLLYSWIQAELFAPGIRLQDAALMKLRRRKKRRRRKKNSRHATKRQRVMMVSERPEAEAGAEDEDDGSSVGGGYGGLPHDVMESSVSSGDTAGVMTFSDDKIF